MRFRLLLLCVASVCQAQVYLGPGCTTAYHIDKDCDGYGVGTAPYDPNPVLGPDADDNDATVHTAAQFISKWGSLTTGLSHLGYTPNRILYVSASGGSGVPNDPNTPYSEAAAIAATQAGDMLLFRAGTYTTAISAVSGTSGHPTIYKAYPGELAVLDTTTNRFTATNVSWFVIDGLKLVNSATGAGDGVDGSSYYATPATCQATPSACPSLFHDVVLTNLEIANCYWGMHIMNGLVNLTISGNVIHNDVSVGEHNIYLGGREQISSNVATIGNVLYNSGASGNAWKFNGRCTGCSLTGNIAWNSAGAGYDFENGWTNSTATNNLSFQNKTGMMFYNYDNGCSTNYICSYDQTGNVIENNTFVISAYLRDGTGNTGSAIKVFHDSATYPTTVGDLGNNTFSNNVIVTGQDSHYAAILYEPGRLSLAVSELASSTFSNNLVWSTHAGVTAIVSKGETDPSYGYTGYNCAQFATMATVTNCINVNPLFKVVGTWDHPESYKFILQAGSPALAAGTTTGAPATDIRGLTRSTPPNIGSYQDAQAPVAPIITTTSPLTSGTVGVAYSFQFTATGDTPMTWTYDAVPGGLTFTSGGLLSGTPTIPGMSRINVTATNAAGSAGPTGFSLAIGGAGVYSQATGRMTGTIK